MPLFIFFNAGKPKRYKLSGLMNESTPSNALHRSNRKENVGNWLSWIGLGSNQKRPQTENADL